ncbi:MAG: hypothetical protein ACTHJ3_11680 [Pararhizobium sp.]
MAEEHAKRVVPPPKYDPGFAGIMAFFCTGIVVMIFLAFAGLEAEDFGMALSWTALAGGLAVYFWFRQQRTAHSKAFAEKMSELRASNRDAQIGTVD